MFEKVINGLTFIPYGAFTEKQIENFFGPAEKKIQENDTLIHFLYPSKGVAVRLDKKGKEALQYITPAKFDKLISPLVREN